jgi:hypothetical protein
LPNLRPLHFLVLGMPSITLASFLWE